jgi:hypothetical protein
MGDKTAADEGTLFHECMRNSLLAKEQAIPESVAPLFYRAKKWVDSIHPGKDRGVETEMNVLLVVGNARITLTGHIDLFDIFEDGTARGLDWKTGRMYKDYSSQMVGYDILLCSDYRLNKKNTWIIYWARESLEEAVEVGPADRERFIYELKRRMFDDHTFTPGEHCANCRRRAHCPAYFGYVDKCLSILGGGEIVEKADPKSIIEAYQKLKVVEDACATVRDAIRLMLIKSGAVSYDGNTLHIKEVSRRELIPELAIHVMERFIKPEHMASCVKLVLSNIEKAAKANAGRGDKGKIYDLLMEQLDLAGAVKINKTSSVSIVPTDKYQLTHEEHHEQHSEA